MQETLEFLQTVLDTITEHIVVIDDRGSIIYVNRSWKTFWRNNSCLVDDKWKGINYLEECDKAAASGDELGQNAADGIRKVIKSDLDSFYLEYPCHSLNEKRWFMMRVAPFTLQNTKCLVISHLNITDLKKTEQKVLELSNIDGLTGIANRRRFDEFLESEWNRCHRLNMSISLALIDLDHFKLLNDTYGHQVGDDCLKLVAKTLTKHTKRPGDICARYGGEEFALVYGNTTIEDALAITNSIIKDIQTLNITNVKSPTMPILTVSIGVVSMKPNDNNSIETLFRSADTLLYSAKKKGRNQIVYEV